MNCVDHVTCDGVLLAIIVRASFSEQGVHFFTPNEYSQQVAFMRHASGKQIEPHVHNPVTRTVHFTKEVLFIRKGRLRVDFYTSERVYVSSRSLETGDVILLAEGGHGFVCESDVEMIEVKQGPYAGDMDKTRFLGVGDEQIIIEGDS
jgi:mannose-6-phosphate isomerase-like protein (cupin superfamily)